MDSKIIFQDKYKINDLHAAANKAAISLSEILAKVAEMTGQKPKETDITDFAAGGHVLSNKLDEVTRSDARNFRSSSAKQAFEFALKTEQLKLSELQEEFIKVLHDRGMLISNFDLKSLTLVPKESWFQAIVEAHTVRISEGSPRYMAFHLAQTAAEVLAELKALTDKHGKQVIFPVELQINNSPKGLIFLPDNLNNPSIELQNFDILPDEVP